MIKRKLDYEKVSNIILINLALLVFLYILILVAIRDKSILIIDKTVAGFASGNRARFFDYFFVILSYLGETRTIAILCLLLLLLPSRKRLGLPVTILTITSALLNLIIKVIIMRTRPQGFFLSEETLLYSMPTSYSFPSGHAQTANIFYLSLTLFSLKYYKTNWAPIVSTVLIVLFCTLMCFARLYLGVHFFSDILAGLSLMIFLLSLCLYIVRYTNLYYLNIYE